jgi:DNA-binding response OmpR family regulator
MAEMTILSESRRGIGMLFDKRRRVLKRLLVVEDEPLVAFENEHALTEEGYVVVATVDRVAEAVHALENEIVDLVLADVRLSGNGDGVDVARVAQARGVPVLFVSGHCPIEAQKLAVGCLAKPYRQKDLLEAIDAVAAHLQGKSTRRAPPGLTFYS